MASQHARERIQQFAIDVARLGRLIKDARLGLPLAPLAAGYRAELDAWVHLHAVARSTSAHGTRFDPVPR